MAPIGGVRAGYLSAGKDAIPDSVASREDDDGTGGRSTVAGLAIEFSESFSEFGARISNNTTGATRALVTDASETVIDSVDISSLSGGDAFTFSGDFEANTEYRVVVDANGSDFTAGFSSVATNYPYTSSDVDIVAKVDGSSTNQDEAHGVNDIGYVGFS